MKSVYLLTAAVLVFLSSIVVAQTKPTYEVYAIRYASLPDFPVSDLVSGADRARKLDLAMTIWLVRGGGHSVLVDAGFYHERFFKEWKVKDFIKPADALAGLGIKPDDITDVVLTHMHWDHVDGSDLFPKAHIWIQKDELEYYAGEAWETKDTSDGIDPEDVLELVKLNTEGRVGLVHGDAQEILPGLTCYAGGRHTYQSQYVGVNTAGGTVILASDNMYLYENMEKHVPIAETLDAASNLRAQDRMKRMATRPEWVIPGHDPSVFDKFPKIGERVVKIQ